jgi:hypothetical protein
MQQKPDPIPIEPDFLPLAILSQLTGYATSGLRNQHYSGKGPLAGILTRLGSKVGAWRPDYEAWRDAQRRLKSASEQRPAA